MEIVTLPLAKLRRRLGSRRLVEGKLPSLMDSIREVGIIAPLRVRSITVYEGGRAAEGWEVTAGAHRMEAASRLKMETVPCVVADDDDLHAELAMIDENLCRAELSPAEVAQQTARRKEIYETLYPEAASYAFKGNQHSVVVSENSAFTTDTAKATGRSARAIQIDAARGRALGDDLAAIAGTSLDKGVELDALAKLPEPERKSLVDRAVKGEAVSARQVKLADEPLNDFESKEKQVAALMAAWNKAGPEAREEFLSRIDQPLMDRRYA